MRRELCRIFGAAIAFSFVFQAAAQPCTHSPNTPTSIEIRSHQSCGVAMAGWVPYGVTFVQSYRTFTPQFVNPVAATRTPVPIQWAVRDYQAPQNVQLYYWISHVNACGESAPAGPFPVFVSTEPPPMTNLHATASVCGVRLDWGLPTGGYNALDHATIWRSASLQFSNAERIATIPSSQYAYSDSTGIVGVTYQYWVQSQENVCSGGVVGPIAIARTGLLDTPSLSITSPYFCGRVLVTPGVVACATSYTLYRNRAPGDATLIQLVADWREPYDDSDVVAGQDYVYRCVAHGPALDSAMSQPRTGRAGVLPPSLGDIGDQNLAPGSILSLAVPINSRGNGTYAFRWRKDGVALADGGRVQGGHDEQLIVTDCTYSDSGLYDVIVSDACGSTASSLAFINVSDFSDCPPFIADYNQDGGVDGQDVAAFFMDWEQGLPCADANQDGGVDGQDVATFFICWEAC